MTPVILLTGFLGSGKTTLLARLLRDPSLADTAVLVNEFGEVALDHHLIERLDEMTVVLESGCLCCTVNGELSAAVRDLHSRRARGTVPPFRRLVIEASGLADPSPIIATFSADTVLRHHYRVVSVVATVDAVHAPKTLAMHPESCKQAAVADWLVMTKSDIAGADTIEAAIQAVRSINPDAGFAFAGDEDLQSLMEPWTHRARSGFFCGPVIDGPSDDHLRAIRSTPISFEGSVDWHVFGIWLTMLLYRHADDVLRVKAILSVEGALGSVAIHGVQNLVHPPTHLAAPIPAGSQSRAVFIHRGEMGDAIIRSLNAFGISARRWEPDAVAA